MIVISTTSRSEHCTEFVPTEELVRRQGVKPLRSADELAQEDAFSSDEEYEEFLRDLYVARRRS